MLEFCGRDRFSEEDSQNTGNIFVSSELNGKATSAMMPD